MGKSRSSDAHRLLDDVVDRFVGLLVDGSDFARLAYLENLCKELLVKSLSNWDPSLVG